jgi:hypothetical protein
VGLRVRISDEGKAMTWGKLDDLALYLTFLLCFLAVAVDTRCQEQPKQTGWKVVVEPAPRQVQFWTVRKWQEPPLRANKQTLRSPWFIVPHVLAVGASVANVTRARKAGAGYAGALGPLAVVGGLDFVADRYITRIISVGVAGYVIALRTRGAVKGTYQ